MIGPGEFVAYVVAGYVVFALGEWYGRRSERARRDRAFAEQLEAANRASKAIAESWERAFPTSWPSVFKAPAAPLPPLTLGDLADVVEREQAAGRLPRSVHRPFEIVGGSLGGDLFPLPTFEPLVLSALPRLDSRVTLSEPAAAEDLGQPSACGSETEESRVEASSVGEIESGADGGSSCPTVDTDFLAGDGGGNLDG